MPEKNHTGGAFPGGRNLASRGGGMTHRDYLIACLCSGLCVDKNWNTNLTEEKMLENAHTIIRYVDCILVARGE